MFSFSQSNTPNTTQYKKPSSTTQPYQDFTHMLGRTKIAEEIRDFLENFDENSRNIQFKKGIYIYGQTGCGKTEFVTNLLRNLNYDIIRYDAGDVRNKTLIDTITSNNISNRNILDMMNRRMRRIVIVMDEIDGMNNGDKGGITSLIKLIRQKKTKKQRSEDITLNPIICIGNYFMDKKIRELMKVCNVFELKPPTDTQVGTILDQFMGGDIEGTVRNKMIKYIQGDLRKLEYIRHIYQRKPEMFRGENASDIFHRILKTKTHIEDSKRTTQLLIQRPIPIEKHNEFMNETDRTIVALLWHENIVDALGASPVEHAFPFYCRILENMCYADYIDRITFQNQIWQFNEMSSMMKTFYNNRLFHAHFPENGRRYMVDEVRFTKVLTKYSTEYNNMLFIYAICKELDMDKKDVVAFFQEVRLIHGEDFLSRTDLASKIDELLENLNINKLDLKRIYRYLDKNVKKDVVVDDEFGDEG